LRTVGASTKFADGYRRIPNGLATILSAIASFVVAFAAGLLAGVAGMYLYDRANSKGDDFAVGLGGFFAAGIFAFVVVFTWLQKLHHPISSSTPLFAWFACMALAIVATALGADPDYMLLIIGDWVAIALFSCLTWVVCRRWLE
jgi:hypothetical protein